MSIKSFNILNLIGNILPSTKRSTNIIGYLNSLLAPLSGLHSDTFNDYYDDEVKLALRHNQVPIYEKTLNESFGLTYSFGGTNSIYITHDSDSAPDVFIFEDGESDVTYFFNANEADVTYVFNEIEIATPYDYEINVDSTLNLNLNKVNSIAVDHNMIDKTYKIKEY